MGLSYKQVRYLWAIGYFKSGGAKGKVGSKVPTKHPPQSLIVHSETEAHKILDKHYPDLFKEGSEVLPYDTGIGRGLAAYRNPGYIQMNEALRHPTPENRNAKVVTETDVYPTRTKDYTVHEANTMLDQVFEKHGIPLHTDMALHRSLRGDYAEQLAGDITSGKVPIGSIMQDPGFTSTSVHTNGGWDSPITVRIHAPKGTKVLPGNGDQTELILNRNSKFEILGFTQTTTEQAKAAQIVRATVAVNRHKRIVDARTRQQATLTSERAKKYGELIYKIQMSAWSTKAAVGSTVVHMRVVK